MTESHNRPSSGRDGPQWWGGIIALGHGSPHLGSRASAQTPWGGHGFITMSLISRGVMSHGIRKLHNRDLNPLDEATSKAYYRKSR